MIILQCIYLLFTDFMGLHVSTHAQTITNIISIISTIIQAVRIWYPTNHQDGSPRNLNVIIFFVQSNHTSTH